MTANHKLLVIDSDEGSLRFLKELLKQDYIVLAAETGAKGIEIARQETPSLILLDLKLSDITGTQVCDQLRQLEETAGIPVVVVSSAVAEQDRIDAYSSGADDFLAKPFVARELVARIGSKIRRIEERRFQDEIIHCGNLALNLHKLEASLNRRIVRLSVLEFTLLKFFVQNKETVLSREKIMESIWRDDSVSPRAIDTHIVSLRKKLEGFDYMFKTVYGAGYILRQSLFKKAPVRKKNQLSES